MSVGVAAIGLLAIVSMLIHTINDTLRQLRNANRAARRPAPTQRDARQQPSERSHAA
jgi:heme exporter protein D